VAGVALPASSIGLALGVLATIAVLGTTVAIASTSSSSIGPLVVVAVLGVLLTMLVEPRKILIAVLILDVPLQWDFNLHYDRAAASLGALGGLDISITTLALAGLFALAFADVSARRNREPFLRNGIGKRAVQFFGAFVALTTLSVVVADNRQLALFEVILLAQTFVLFLYLVHALRTREEIGFVAIILVGALILETGIMLAQHFAGFEFSKAGLSTASSAGFLDGGRIGGTLGSPNAAGTFLALLLVPALSLLRTPLPALVRWAAVGAFGLGTIALILTSSRGAWFGLPLALIAVFVAVLIPLHSEIASRLETNDNGSAASRVPLMHLAGDMVQQHPLLGIGSNNFAVQIPKYAGPSFSRDWIYTVHNKFFLIAAEAGIPTMVVFVLFLGTMIRVGMSAGRTRDPLLGPLALGLTAGIAGQIVTMLVEPFHSRSEMQGLVVVSAILVAIAQRVQIENEGVQQDATVELPLEPVPRQAPERVLG
jgi:putative inorganic carbon (HCO3(-)) transporter